MASAACPLCESPAAFPLRSRDRELYACATCNLVYVPRRWHLSPAAQRDRYRLHQNRIDDDGYARMLQRPIDVLRQRAPGVRRVLDYGSGPTPVLVELLRRRGYDAEGYDPLFSPRTHGPASFDAVVSVETFEHFADPGAEMRRIVEIIRPGGWFLVMTHLHGGTDTFTDWWYVRDATHVAFYSARTFDWLCRRWALELAYSDAARLVLMRKQGGPVPT